jgi:ribonuclease HI
MFFDSSKTKDGVIIGCVLIDPKSRKKIISSRLEFECTNNTAKYESLVQGLKKAIDLEVKHLKVFGDSEIIVRQVRNTIHFLSPHLKAYQQEVWNFLYSFDAFNINSIPHDQNVDVDILANATSRFMPPDDGFSIELMFRPSIPDNVTSWRVFDCDSQIFNFLTSLDTFQNSVIDDEIHQQELQYYREETDKIKTNCVPKNVLTLEKLFDLQSKFRRPTNLKTNNSMMMHFLVNLGTYEQPKYVNLGTYCSDS